MSLLASTTNAFEAVAAPAVTPNSVARTFPAPIVVTPVELIVTSPDIATESQSVPSATIMFPEVAVSVPTLSNSDKVLAPKYLAAIFLYPEAESS